MVYTILFVALFCGVQMLPLVQSQHYMELLGTSEDDQSATHNVVLGLLQGAPFSLFWAYGAYAPLTYKVPLAKLPSQLRPGTRMLSSRLDLSSIPNSSDEHEGIVPLIRDN